MSQRILSLAAAALVVSAGSAAAQDFRELARQDLRAAHAELRDNHPAFVIDSPASAAYREWLDRGLAQAEALIPRVNSGDSHAYLMRYYAAGFRDPGVRINPTFEGLGPYFGTGWPGLATGWRNGEYVVTYALPGVRGLPPVGARVVECNATPIEEYARHRLDRWEGDLDTEAGRIRTAPYLLWNRNNPFTGGVPTTCKFQEGRRARDYRLTPQPLQAGQLEAAYRATVYMPSGAPLAIEQVDGRPWVRVQSLAEDAGWEGFSAQVEAQAAQLRGSQGFVLDLRGADQQAWSATARGYALANRIWTPEYAATRHPPAGTISFRATRGNRDWYAQTLSLMEADPLFLQEAPGIVEDTRRIVAAFDEALTAGQTSFSIQGRDAAPDTGVANPVQGPVVVLVDSGCAGACLDLLDLLSRMPNVRVAGHATQGATIFVEPTTVRLPSNYSDLLYGHKAWVSRARGDQPYAPQGALAYTGDPADEAAVRAWIAGLFGG